LAQTGFLLIEVSRKKVGSSLKNGCAPPVGILAGKNGHKKDRDHPRHKPRHLSLLPSGPDEVRGRLLRGGRSNGP